MAKSISPPWLENTLLDLLSEDNSIDSMDDDASVNSKTSKTKKFHHSPKVVQVLFCKPHLRLLEVSDGQNSINVFYSSACDSVIENIGAQEMKGSIVKLKGYHMTMTVIATGDRDPNQLMQYGRLSFPFAIFCKDFQYIGGHDLEKIGSPTNVNFVSSIKSQWDPNSYTPAMRRLAKRQFGKKYLPQADGEEGVGDEIFSDQGWQLTRENVLDLDSAEDVVVIDGDDYGFDHAKIVCAYLKALPRVLGGKTNAGGSTFGLQAIAETLVEGDEEANPDRVGEIEKNVPVAESEIAMTQLPSSNYSQSQRMQLEENIFHVPSTLVATNEEKGTLRESQGNGEEEEEEEDLLGGQVITMLDRSNAPITNSPLAATQVPDSREHTQSQSQTLKETQVPENSETSSTPNKQVETMLPESQTNNGNIQNQTVLSYEEVASQLEPDFLVSCSLLEAKMGVLASSLITQLVPTSIHTQTQLPSDSEAATSQQSDAQMKVQQQSISSTGSSSANKETNEPVDIASSVIPLFATGENLVNQVRSHGSDFIGQKVAKYSDGLEFREIRGIVRDFDSKNNTFVIEFETGEILQNVPADIASYNFVMDDVAKNKAGSADWSSDYPPPAWPMKTVRTSQPPATNNQSSSSLSPNKDDDRERVVVPFVLPPATPKTMSTEENNNSSVGEVENRTDRIQNEKEVVGSSAAAEEETSVVSIRVTRSRSGSNASSSSASAKNRKQKRQFHVVPLPTLSEENESEGTDDDMVMTQAQPRYVECEENQGVSQSKSAASSLASRGAMLANKSEPRAYLRRQAKQGSAPDQTPTRRRSVPHADPDIVHERVVRSTDTIVLKRQVDALLADFDTERNISALETDGFVSDSDSSLRRFFRNSAASAPSAAASSMAEVRPKTQSWTLLDRLLTSSRSSHPATSATTAMMPPASSGHPTGIGRKSKPSTTAAVVATSSDSDRIEEGKAGRTVAPARSLALLQRLLSPEFALDRSHNVQEYYAQRMRHGKEYHESAHSPNKKRHVESRDNNGDIETYKRKRYTISRDGRPTSPQLQQRQRPELTQIKRKRDHLENVQDDANTTQETKRNKTRSQEASRHASVLSLIVQNSKLLGKPPKQKR